MTNWRKAGIALMAAASLLAMPLQAQEAAIRKVLQERLPHLGKIDEITKSPLPGLYEVRYGANIYYVDPTGNFLIEGALVDTKAQKNLTEERQNKLLAVDFDKLPLNDAFKIVRGNGKRKIAIFEDPNCGYCKRFEQDLQKVDNVTVYLFLYPILGQDSVEKARNLWCSKDKSKAWQDWMVRSVPTPAADCDVQAVMRNVEFGRKYRINGTPTTFSAIGTRRPGAMPLEAIEQMAAESKS